MKSSSNNSTTRLNVLSRITAAVFGGYAMSQAVSIAVAAILPISRGEGVLSAMILSFAIYTVAIIWAFAARTATRAWLGLLLPILILALPVWFIVTGGGIA